MVKTLTKMMLSVIVGLTLMLPLGTTQAFASNGFASGGNSSSNGGSATSFLGWVYDTSVTKSNGSAKYDLNVKASEIEDGFLKTVEKPAKDSGWAPKYFGPYSKATVDNSSNKVSYGTNTYWAATVVRTGSEGGCITQIKEGNDGKIASAWSDNHRLKAFFYDNRGELVKKGWNNFKRLFDSSCDCLVSTGTNRIVFRIWYDETTLPNVTSTFTKTVYRITKSTLSVGGSTKTTYLDHTAKTAKWLYNNGNTSGTYSDVTPPTGTQSYDYTGVVSVTRVPVKKTIKITTARGDAPSTFAAAEKMIDNGSSKIVSKEVTYETKTATTSSKTIKYKSSVPSMTQTKYVPLNLNRNSFVENGDGGITSDWTSGTKLNATVDNLNDITDNKDIRGLDINSDKDMTLSFNNNSYGIPGTFSTPTDLANGTYEPVTGSYANGRGTTEYRYNLSFDASITGIYGGVPTSSLTAPNGSEAISKDSITLTNGIGSGDWTARFIMSGDFNTDNGLGLSDFKKNYWCASYDQARFYEYGMGYNGTYSLSGSSIVISDPSQTTPSDAMNKTVSGTTTTFTHKNASQRGIYVGVNKDRYVQPILYGHWKVETLGGDTRM